MMHAEPADERFEQLYRDFGGRIVVTLTRLTGSREDGEDLAQQTFLSAWQSWSSFRGASAPATWIHAIALRTFANWWRLRERRPNEVSESVGDGYCDAISPLVADPDDELERAIARLPTQMRHAVVLHYLAGYSVSEIAAAFGKAPGTVKAQLYAARAKLRERLTDD